MKIIFYYLGVINHLRKTDNKEFWQFKDCFKFQFKVTYYVIIFKRTNTDTTQVVLIIVKGEEVKNKELINVKYFDIVADTISTVLVF